ncbi:MAG: hypothetical protein H7306_25560 [Bacteriovorax sp.]|nr:hypothetical protein [Rhizobacter sp.]
MLNTPEPDVQFACPLPLLAAADLQDNLLTAGHDLDRLQTLLSHACDELMQGFYGATDQIRSFVESAETDGPMPDLLAGVTRHLGAAITALQFQDMASQLIAHTHQRLRNCADRLARETMGDDEDGYTVVEEAPLRPNPVTQDEMDAGSVELF